MATRCVIGVDLGGTNVRAAAVADDGRFVGPRINNSSEAEKGAEATFEAIARTVREAAEGASMAPDAVGIAIPGWVDESSGMVRWSPNFGTWVNGVFHYWVDVPYREPLENLLKLPICAGNDANLAALGEYSFGTGQGNARCLVMLTLGTGIGGGVVLSSSSVGGHASGPLLLLGGNKGGAELGHTIVQHGGVDCTSGEYGSIEAYCQRDAIVKRATLRLVRGRPSLLRDMCGGDYSQVSPKMLADAADQGDELAIEVWQEVGTYLGVGIGSLINTFAPDVFAVGGQIAKAGKWIMEPAIRTARNVAIPQLFDDARIVLAQQVEDAGLLGAAAWALESTHTR